MVKEPIMTKNNAESIGTTKDDVGEGTWATVVVAAAVKHVVAHVTDK